MYKRKAMQPLPRRAARRAVRQQQRLAAAPDPRGTRARVGTKQLVACGRGVAGGRISPAPLEGQHAGRPLVLPGLPLPRVLRRALSLARPCSRSGSCFWELLSYGFGTGLKNNKKFITCFQSLRGVVELGQLGEKCGLRTH